MPQTFYATQDEEILSIVGKLRSSELLENVFIIPKRALVLQSIVNLRMLAREAEKAGKQVVVVTQDENGRRLAEKAGLATRPYSEELSREPEPVIREQPEDESEPRHPGVSAASIGSSGFFATPEESASPVRVVPSHVPEAPALQDGMRLRVRNASPVRQTALNSLRSSEQPQSVAQAVPGIPEVPVAQAVYRPVPPSMRPATVPSPMPQRESIENGGTGRLSQVFASSRPTTEPDPAPKKVAERKKKRESESTVDGKGKALFAFFVTISVLFLLGTGAFILLPKADISIIPQSVSQDLGLEFEGKADASAEGDNVIPMRLVEKEEEITVTGTASGASSGSGSKASGKIIIYNEFSSEPQPLVATTRFQSGDGKVFRLSKGVTVPGVSIRSGQKEPGVAETEVVADATGKEYNVGSTDFSIPGFSGSSKAGKIYAKSKSPMVGGSSSGSSETTAVSSSDIERAKNDAVGKFRDSFADSLGKDIAGNERFIKETFDVSPVGSPSVPTVGSVASSFEYRATFHGKAFVFSEDELRDRAAATLRKKASVGDGFSTKNVAFRYDGGTPDYSAGTLHFKVGVNALFVASIDTVALREDFLGKKQDEIRQVLESHPEVKNIDIEIKPKGLSFAVPKDRTRVFVTVVEP